MENACLRQGREKERVVVAHVAWHIVARHSLERFYRDCVPRRSARGHAGTPSSGRMAAEPPKKQRITSLRSKTNATRARSNSEPKARSNSHAACRGGSVPDVDTSDLQVVGSKVKYAIMLTADEINV